VVTLADARRIIAAAEKKADDIGQPVNVAVVDSGRNLLALPSWIADQASRGTDRGEVPFSISDPFARTPKR
jgi:uncharacterized protein GlcG (DUF336 family)